MWFNFRSRHIALRQDHYETALLFLMRRARLDIANKNGQKPFECMPSKNPKCATIVKLTTTLQDLMKDSLKQRLERIICNDLTRGKETNPVQCVNDLDDDNDPEDYVYIKSNVVTKDIPLDRNISTLQVGLFIPFSFSMKFKLNWLKCSSGHPLFWLAFNNYVDIILPFFEHSNSKRDHLLALSTLLLVEKYDYSLPIPTIFFEVFAEVAYKLVESIFILH